MYAIEFETDITGKYIELKDYEQLLNKHAKVIILVDEDNQSKKPVTKVMKQLQQFNEIINQRVNLPKVVKKLILTRYAIRLTVIFFDTNVLDYFAINQDTRHKTQDTRKQSVAQASIQQAIENKTLVISPLVMINILCIL